MGGRLRRHQARHPGRRAAGAPAAAGDRRRQPGRPRRLASGRRRLQRSGACRRASTAWSPGCASASSCATCTAARSAIDVARDALERGIALGGEAREVVGAVRRRRRLHRARAERTAAGARSSRCSTRSSQVVVDVVHEHGGWSTSSRATPRCACSARPLTSPTHAAPRARRARARCAPASTGARRRLDAGIGVAAGTVVAGNVGAESALRVHGDRRPGQRGRAPHRARQAARSSGCWPAATRSTAPATRKPRAGALDGEVTLRGRECPTRVAVPAYLTRGSRVRSTRSPSTLTATISPAPHSARP